MPNSKNAYPRNDMEKHHDEKTLWLISQRAIVLLAQKFPAHFH
ncbi:hypothetical protein DB29_02870 [Shouchella clausii]|nr:hypothetical protein DB29_02870 [Shouchella clausii]